MCMRACESLESGDAVYVSKLAQTLPLQKTHAGMPGPKLNAGEPLSGSQTWLVIKLLLIRNKGRKYASKQKGHEHKHTQ